MPRENLTFTSPDDSRDETNPFIDVVSDSEPDSNGVRRSLSAGEEINNVNNNPNNIASESNNFSKLYADYSGTSSEQASSSNAPSTFNDPNFEKTNNVNNNIVNTPLLSLVKSKPTSPHETFLPPKYDRYPAIVNSQKVLNSNHSKSSLLRMGATVSQTEKGSYITSPSTDKQQSPFLIDSDFSPFGGYPTSSFPLHIDEKEPDDYLHNPDPIEDAKYDHRRMLYDLRSLDKRSGWGLAGFLFLLVAAVVVFILVPALTYTGITDHPKNQVYEILTRYKYPQLSAIRSDLVDPDTPKSALKRTAKDGSEWNLVFSDEFNKEGRTFYDGDDQFFVAPDFHYDATKDLEWYDPDAVSTANGTLNLRMDAYENHNLFYRSGMVQSWNKMCFTQGILEVSAMFPNYGNVTGLWPGIWSMGNLGRPGYLATTEGVWPYSYEECDAGITPNQSSPDGINYLPGQRLNSCTCKGEDHPNPGIGRGAPEIDAIEAAADSTLGVGVASQTFQIAPFDIWYYPDMEFIEIHNDSVTSVNTYTGGPFQQAVSAVSTLNTTWYEFGDNSDHRYQKISYEYLNDNDDGYIRWFVGDDPTFTVNAKALHPNGNIGWRRISKEPMTVILNMGISNSWAYIDWESIKFPVTFRIDYVRIYQPPDAVNVGCDPEDYPTKDYIQNHLNAYSNVNLTSWEQAGYMFPKNKLTGNC